MGRRPEVLLAAFVLLFVVRGDEPPALLEAAGEGDIKAVKLLLAEGADVNVKSATGETALHVAGIKCVRGVAKALLEAGADVNAQTNDGAAMLMTPLHWYVNMNSCSTEDIDELLQAGADTNIRNSQGETPLDMVSKVSSVAQ